MVWILLFGEYCNTQFSLLFNKIIRFFKVDSLLNWISKYNRISGFFEFGRKFTTTKKYPLLFLPFVEFLPITSIHGFSQCFEHVNCISSFKFTANVRKAHQSTNLTSHLLVFLLTKISSHTRKAYSDIRQDLKYSTN